MTTDLCSGIIPSQYREFYEICSFNGEPIHQEVYQCFLSQCKVTTIQLKEIWDLLRPVQNSINRTSFYKTLALLAFAQQGKLITDKLFDSCSGKEYPIPIVGDLNPVKNLKMKIHMTDKLNAGFVYADIVQLDTINIELMPEKKGLFLKYSEYIVSSRRFNRQVTRRYNDFVALHELLLNRFPYRLIPILPPKKIVSDAHFLESRRRALHRWLTLICRHPTISHDSILSFFLTDQGPDIQYRIRDIFKRCPDEFMTSDIAGNAKDLLPADYSQIASSREQIRLLVQVVGKLKYLTEKSVERQQTFAKDAEDLSEQLRTLSTSNVGQSSSFIKHWGDMQQGFGLISRDLKLLPAKANLQADLEQIQVCERLGLLLDILTAHKELCERLEKGLANDHQAALSKMLSLKKRKIQGVIRGTDAESVEQLEAKMMTQESVIMNMELRSDYSLYCIHMETQLVYAYLETLSSIFQSMINLKIETHTKFKEIWQQVQPMFVAKND
ncbi:unnamed protein product [Brassicogethes aeneus]|uniref:PX domain-containing protein n=1 Tax=Brassicogethes aeneus TaxID=1431903 RepID=A0A9P0FMT1_BRAAE|nr:unnamed protein product [Brassicogethes aeneus]